MRILKLTNSPDLPIPRWEGNHRNKSTPTRTTSQAGSVQRKSNIAATTSAMPWQSQEWIHRQIKGSQFEVFEEAEGGQHFMFIENPEKFNRLVMEYLG
jgi:hypothetical protein